MGGKLIIRHAQEYGFETLTQLAQFLWAMRMTTRTDMPFKLFVLRAQDHTELFSNSTLTDLKERFVNLNKV